MSNMDIPVSFNGKIWNIKVTAPRLKEIMEDTPQKCHERYIANSRFITFPKGCKCTSTYFCNICYEATRKKN